MWQHQFAIKFEANEVWLITSVILVLKAKQNRVHRQTLSYCVCEMLN